MPQPEPPTPPSASVGARERAVLAAGVVLVGAASPAAGARERPGVDALTAQLAALSGMDAPALRAQWRRLYRSHPPKKLSRALLELGVAWKVQEQALGGLKPAATRRLDALAQALETGAGIAGPRRVTLRPGARLIRAWGGETHEVLVSADGFVWQGRTWRSLSAIARAITGTRWSGPRFFGLAGPANTGRP
jgi:hypothetical protein